MTNMIQLIEDESAATAIEYGLVAALIAIAIMGVLNSVATETSDMWDYISTTLVNAIQ